MQKVAYDAVREEWGQVKCNCSHAVFQNAWHSEFLLKHVLQGHIFPLRHLSRPGKGQHDSSRGIDNSRMSHSNSANRLPRIVSFGMPHSFITLCIAVKVLSKTLSRPSERLDFPEAKAALSEPPERSPRESLKTYTDKHSDVAKL